MAKAGPLEEGLDPFVIATAPLGTHIPEGWFLWASSHRDWREENGPGQEVMVIRATAGMPLPPGWLGRGHDEPIGDLERVFVLKSSWIMEELAIRGIQLGGAEDLDRMVRVWRGDPWYLPYIHDAPVTFNQEEAWAAGEMTASGPNIVLVFPAEFGNGWTVELDFTPCPGVYVTSTEAKAAGLDFWQKKTAVRLEEIRVARGGTLSWGRPVVIPPSPAVILLPHPDAVWRLVG